MGTIAIITLLMLTVMATVHSERTNGEGGDATKPKIASQNYDEQITGLVSRVIDGDTFVVNGKKIRLCGINAPKNNQIEGQKSTQYLEQLIGSKFVSCKIVGSGTPCDGRSNATSYDRTVAQCFIGGEDVGCLMVRSGNAKDFKRFSDGYYQRKCSQ